MTWMPKVRAVTYADRPEWLPHEVYNEARAAKKFYNAEWEFWVYLESQKANVSQAVAEDACIRGLKIALDRIDFVYGPRIARWYREYLDMDSVFNTVKHPEYTVLRLDKGEK